MKRWKALTGAAVALALVIAPLVSTTATAAETSTPVGAVGVIEPWTPDTNKVSYWKERFQDHAVECYSSDKSTSHGRITDGGKTVTLNPYGQDWPGDHWEVLVIKGGSDTINVIWHPTAGVAYASPQNDGGNQANVSHWIVCKGETPALLPATASVKVTDPSCLDPDGLVFVTHTHSTVTSATLDGVPFSVEGFTSGGYPNPKPGVYKLVLTADKGYGFGSDKTPTLTLTFTVKAALTADDCPETVTPVVPVWVDDCGLGNGFWSYPSETVGYHYVPSTVNGVKTVELVKEAGFVFPEGTKTTYQATDSGELCPAVIPALFDAEPTAPTCDTAGGLPNLSGTFPNVTFELTGPEVPPGEYTLTVTPNAGFAFDPAALPEGWTLNEDGSASRTFSVLGATGIYQDEDPEADCYAELIPGEVVSQCVGSVPYLAYALDVEGFETDSDTPVTITFVHPTDSAQNFTVANQPLTGTLLWPGASDGTPQQWPGWELLEDGTYVETDGNFAWTRAAEGITVLFEVNPTVETTVFYPAESALCANPVNDVPGDPGDPSDPSDPSDPATPAALPATGGVDMTPWGIGAALMLIAGAALLTTRRLARR